MTKPSTPLPSCPVGTPDYQVASNPSKPVSSTELLAQLKQLLSGNKATVFGAKSCGEQLSTGETITWEIVEGFGNDS